jgi:CO/xanthine dehydrogenase Mo-binding subunit
LPTTAAVCKAAYDATGKRIHQLPIRIEGLL